MFFGRMTESMDKEATSSTKAMIRKRHDSQDFALFDSRPVKFVMSVIAIDENETDDGAHTACFMEIYVSVNTDDNDSAFWNSMATRGGNIAVSMGPPRDEDLAHESHIQNCV